MTQGETVPAAGDEGGEARPGLPGDRGEVAGEVDGVAVGDTAIDRTGLAAVLLPVSGSHPASTVPVVGLTRAMWLRVWALAVALAPNLVNSPPTYSQEPDSARA